MGCGETDNLNLASMDFYTGVKLRASNARFRKSNRITPISSENRRGINLKHDGLNRLLQAMKGDLHNEITETRETSKESNKTNEKCSSTKIKHFIWENLSAELTAVEMLKALSKGHSSDFGELVWGKFYSHPWWPGQIYEESLSSISTCFRKEKGCVLVAFFGDNTCAWLNPKHIVPFLSHFDEKSKVSKDLKFLKAVEEAILEIKKRSALGLSCKCLNHCVKFKDCEVEGFFRVDVAGYGGGSAYSVEQIKKARNGFRPPEMLTFLEKLALRPMFLLQNDVASMRNVARILAYRKAVFVESDETYAEAFEVTEEKAHEAPFTLDIGIKGFVLSKKRGIADNYQGKKIIKRKKKTKFLDCDSQQGDQITEIPSVAATHEKHPTKGTKSWIEDTEPTMLIIRFSPEARLPSVSELKAKFARFGPFLEPGVRVFWKSSTCQVVFVCKSNAQAAYHHALQNRALFGKLHASYYLQGLECSSNGLPDSVGVHEKIPEEGLREVLPFTSASEERPWN